MTGLFLTDPSLQGLWTEPSMPSPPIFGTTIDAFVDQELLRARLATLTGMTDAQRRDALPSIIKELIDRTKGRLVRLQLTVIGTYAAVLVSCLALLAHVRYHRRRALQGHPKAAQRMILPAFEPLLWTFVVYCAVYIAALGPTVHLPVFTTALTKLTLEVLYACRQFVFFVVPAVLFQKNLSTPALLRSLGLAALLAWFTVPVVWLLQDYGAPAQGHVHYGIHVMTRWLILLPCLAVCIWPPARASPRTFREYGLFLVVTLGLVTAATELFRQGHFETAMSVTWAAVAWAGTCPFFIWRLLRADTEHWRGLSRRAAELQARGGPRLAPGERQGRPHHLQRSQPDHGPDDDRLHGLLELYRQLLIDFAHLQLDERLGQGSNAVVLRGVQHCRRRAVAVKIYRPETLSVGVVGRFAREAARQRELRHPNVLRVYGICLCPPTISLVTELCLGSLGEVTRQQQHIRADRLQRQQFLLNIAYMIDAARTVAYLHSFSPPIIHGGIRPSSFLVDLHGFVRLAHLGAARALVEKKPRAPWPPQDSTVLEIHPELLELDHPEYAPPEALSGGMRVNNGESADVYALAITMWDILHPASPKYLPRTAFHALTTSTTMTSVSTAASTGHAGDRPPRLSPSELAEQVCAGQRPPLDAHMYQPLRQLLETAWHAEPRLRPRAHELVHILELIQEEASAVFALEIMTDLDCDDCTDELTETFTGARAVERMQALGCAATEAEAVRLGSMLMDTGFLHHVHHRRAFEPRTGRDYYFDHESVHACQPFTSPERGYATIDELAASGVGRRRWRQRPHGCCGDDKDMTEMMEDNDLHHDEDHHEEAAGTSRSHGLRTRTLSCSASLGLSELEDVGCACRTLGQRLFRGPRWDRAQVLVLPRTNTPAHPQARPSGHRRTDGAFQAMSDEDRGLERVAEKWGRMG